MQHLMYFEYHLYMRDVIAYKTAELGKLTEEMVRGWFVTPEAILEKLRGWSGPLGPFRSPESIFDDMCTSAEAVGEDNASSIVAALQASITDPAIDEEIRSDFFSEYAARYPAAIERVLVPTLESQVTPLAILTAGHARAYLSAGRYLGNACLCDRGVVAGGG